MSPEEVRAALEERLADLGASVSIERPDPDVVDLIVVLRYVVRHRVGAAALAAGNGAGWSIDHLEQATRAYLLPIAAEPAQ